MSEPIKENDVHESRTLKLFHFFRLGVIGREYMSEPETRLQQGGLDTAQKHLDSETVGCNWSFHAICAAMFKGRLTQDQLVEALLAWRNFFTKGMDKEEPMAQSPISPL